MIMWRTAKDYQTHESMSVYLRDVLAPYCPRVRDEMNDLTLLIILAMDNGGWHQKVIVSDVYAALNIRIIWLPPESSHVLQPRDLLLVARLKKKYREQ
jgi:hypothetical protein